MVCYRPFQAQPSQSGGEGAGGITVVCGWGGGRGGGKHRRRICTEEKAKVVAAVWGTAFIQILAALSYFVPESG